LGEALFRQSRFQDAIRIWRKGIELPRALDDSDNLALLYANSARAAQDANDPVEALHLCLEGLARVEEAPESSGLARLLQETAYAYANNALREESRLLGRQALEMAERLDDVEVQAYVLASPGVLGLPSVERRLEALTRAIELAESHGQLHAASRAHRNLAHVAQRHQGDYQTARKHLRRAAELDEQAGDSAGQILALNEQAWNSMLCGEMKDAGKILSQIQALLKDLTEPTYAAHRVLVIEGLYFLFLGEWEEGARRQRALLVSARERGDDRELAHAGDLLAYAVLDSNRFLGDVSAGKWEEMEAILAEGTEIWDRSLNIHGSVCNRVWLGLVRLAQGRPDIAQHLLEEARQKATEELAIPEDDGVLHWLQALIASAEGYWTEALAAHEAADRVFDCFGMCWHRARVLLDWAETHAMRGGPGDRGRARELLCEAQIAFKEMGIQRYAAVAQDRLQELGAAEAAAT
jgi:tetratricopeptide (TPR) repeat protein